MTTRDFLTLTPIGAPAPGLIAGNALTAIDAPRKRAPIIGFRTADDRVVGLGGASQIALRTIARRDDVTWNGIAKVGFATAVAAGVVGTRAVGLAVGAAQEAVDELHESREQLRAQIALLERQLVAATARAEKAEARLGVRRKWTDAARAFLADAVRDLGRSSADCRAIAILMTARFGGAWTGPAVRAQVRRMGLV